MAIDVVDMLVRHFETLGAELNWLNRQLVEEILVRGFAMITSTVLKGQIVLRMCTINPRTTGTDIVDTIYRLHTLGKKLI